LAGATVSRLRTDLDIDPSHDKTDTDISFIIVEHSDTINGERITVSKASGAPIAFRSVEKRYGAVTALADFSLDVSAGEFITLLGPSGSGKTTALNVLAGFIEPSGGDVEIAGVSISRLPTEKRNVGMVFQSYSLFPHMNVRDNVAFPLRMRGVAASERSARAEAALAMVRLDGYGDRQPHELSGGQRQRVAFARAVVFEPKVLLMDEPLGALDLKLREAMQDEIRQVQRRIGCTVIYVTHDQGEALAMSDRIVVMSNGRIEQVGTPAEIYDRPINAFVAAFVGETNLLPGRIIDGVLRLGDAPHAHRPPLGLAESWAGRIALRPEYVRRRAVGDGGPAISCEIRDVAFHGSRVRYLADAPGLGALTIVEQRGQGLEPLEVGERAEFALGLDRAAVLAG
jgi:putative spermidine/putrescine transport system ATP-binding protein